MKAKKDSHDLALVSLIEKGKFMGERTSKTLTKSSLTTKS